MQKQHRMRTPLVAVVGLLAGLLLIAPAANAASVTPSFEAGNPSCADLGYTTLTTFDPPNSGTQAGITLTRTGGSSFSWTSTVAVDAVIVKGGPNANLYEYPADTFSDTGLVPPTNPSTGGPYGLSHVEFCTDNNNEPGPNPAISVEKTGVAFAYAGETVTYNFTATNTGNKTLSNVDLVDDKCTSKPVRTGDTSDTTFDPKDVWTYTCTAVVPSGTDSVTNVAEICGEMPGGDVEDSSDDVCDSDTHTFPVRTIDIQVDKKAVETTAVAGSVVHFTIAVTNTGNTDYVQYTFTDTTCIGGATRSGTNAGDTVFNAGDTWTYDCSMQTAVGQTLAENTASATGKNSDDKSVTGTDAASVPLTQPATTGGGETPGGGVLPEETLSGRAQLRGPSGCVKKAFRARVTGRSIASVSFFVDGKLVKRFTGQRASYSIKVRPKALGFGRHKIVARVVFLAASGTKARRLPLTFRRCARQAVAPRFTG
jgi:hypothetical protein